MAEGMSIERIFARLMGVFFVRICIGFFDFGTHMSGNLIKVRRRFSLLHLASPRRFPVCSWRRNSGRAFFLTMAMSVRTRKSRLPGRVPLLTSLGRHLAANVYGVAAVVAAALLEVAVMEVVSGAVWRISAPISPSLPRLRAATLVGRSRLPVIRGLHHRVYRKLILSLSRRT